jgi:hypothetical protein
MYPSYNRAITPDAGVTCDHVPPRTDAHDTPPRCGAPAAIVMIGREMMVMGAEVWEPRVAIRCRAHALALLAHGGVTGRLRQQFLSHGTLPWEGIGA